MALTAKDKQDIKNIFTDLIATSLADISFRIGQAYEVERGRPHGKAYAEDVVGPFHLITGYTVTANSPAAGQIAWADVTMVYNGVSYAIPNGSTTAGMKYVWWDLAAPASFKQSATVPNLTPGSTVVFYNDGGTPREALSGGVSFAVGASVVGNTELGDNLDASKIGTGTLGSGAKVGNANLNTGIDPSKLTGTGTVPTAAVPALDGSKITSGTLGSAVKVANVNLNTGIDPTKLTGTGTVPTAAVPNLDAAKITSGTLPTAVGVQVNSLPSIPGSKLADGAVTPSKMTLLSHFLV